MMMRLRGVWGVEEQQMAWREGDELGASGGLPQGEPFRMSISQGSTCRCSHADKSGDTRLKRRAASPSRATARGYLCIVRLRRSIVCEIRGGLHSQASASLSMTRQRMPMDRSSSAEKAPTGPQPTMMTSTMGRTG